jgi:hypothetical protein
MRRSGIEPEDAFDEADLFSDVVHVGCGNEFQ